ncbi:MAG: DUF2924 domain-containing protein [Terracidiphilus sp.]
MSERLEVEIAALPKMNLAQLQAKWRRVLKQAPPSHIRKQLLVPLLAYKLQEQAFGGLKPEVKRRLRELAAGLHRDSKKTAAQRRDPLRIKPGTRLIRQWEGKTYHVTVGEAGFEYNGERYKSLSAIARLITGTRWSGPLFFGLKGHRS